MASEKHWSSSSGILSSGGVRLDYKTFTALPINSIFYAREADM
jgi:hypothetical protein